MKPITYHQVNWWKHVDWDLPDSVIAEELNMSRISVWQMRKKQGKPAPTKRKSNSGDQTLLPKS